MSKTTTRSQGIKGIDTLNIGMQSFFCSWNFTTDIMLWLPSASVSKPYIGKLTGHPGIVEWCEFTKHSEILISIDNRKMIKIWSI
jgi:hypothetical protein